MNLYKGFNDFITLCSNFFHDYKMYIYIDLYLYASLLYCYHLLGQRAEYVLLLSKAGLFFYKISFYLQKICYTKEKKKMIRIPDNLSYEEYKCFYNVITLTLLYTLCFLCFPLLNFSFCFQNDLFSFLLFQQIKSHFSIFFYLRLLLRKISIFSKPNLISDFSCCP